MNRTPQMTHSERLQAAIRKEEVDRIPISLWGHLPTTDQDPITCAKASLDWAIKFNFDFIKIMPDQFAFMQDFGLSVNITCRPDQKTSAGRSFIRSAQDIRNIEVYRGDHGMLGKTVDLCKYMQKMQKEAGVEIPYIATLNSPLTTLAEARDGGFRAFAQDMREHPEAVHEGLQKMTETTINYLKENLKYGISGFFFASRYSSSDYLTEEEYDEFGTRYDLQLFQAFEREPDAWFNMIHIHGPNTFWKRMADYPGNVINWHDAWIPPTMEQARQITDKCLCGGLHERELYQTSADEVQAQVSDVVRRAGRKGLIIAPGCGLFPTPDETPLFAASAALLNL